MPRLRLLLFASLSANVLLGVLGWHRYAAGGNEEAALEEAVAEAPALRSDSLTEWQMLVRDATDEEFVARLRREGFPPRVIREWLKRRLWMRFADRSRVLGLDAPPVPYWLKVNPVDGAEIERRTKRAALAQENTYQLRELLGADLYCLPGDAAYDNRERLYGDLSLEKIAGIEAIKDDYRSLSDTIQMTSHGTPFPEIRAQLKLLEQQQRADIARLLTPAELEQYERRSSWTAEILQWDLGHFNATEAEYIAMYEARRVFDDRYGVRHLSRQEEELRHAAYPELRAAYEKALGPERFDDFQLMSDDRFGELKGWVEAKGLPQERALAITRILQGADERYHALREARDLERDQRPAELRTLLEETADRIGALVGEDKLDDFMEAAGHFLPEPDPAKLQAVP